MPILRHAFWIAPALVAMSLVGCRFVEKTARMPVEAVTGLFTGAESTPPDLAVVQVVVQRYADDFIAGTATALDEYARHVATPDARSEALGWKLTLGASAIGIASSPNPTANLVEFVGLTTLMRIMLEEHWVKTDRGPAFQPLLDASRTLETSVWKLAEGVLKPAQQQELRDAIRRWREENPDAPGRAASSASSGWTRLPVSTPRCARSRAPAPSPSAPCSRLSACRSSCAGRSSCRPTSSSAGPKSRRH